MTIVSLLGSQILPSAGIRLTMCAGSGGVMVATA